VRPGLRKLLTALKVVVAGYWLWVLVASLGHVTTAFDAIIVMSAPLLLSIHFVQGLMFVRKLRGDVPWWSDFGQIMLFGVLHLAPLLLDGRLRASGPRR